MLEELDRPIGDRHFSMRFAGDDSGSELGEGWLELLLETLAKTV